MTTVTPRQEAVSASARLADVATRRFHDSMSVATAFFESQADTISQACLEMARRFQAGGRLLVFGAGAEATDAHHVSVEFVHPVIVGKRALPAIALTCDVATTTSAARGPSFDQVFRRTLGTIGRPADIAMGISRDAGNPAVHAALVYANSHGMLSISLTGRGSSEPSDGARYVFAVPSDDAMVVQEVHETLYHILWELVHVFFEHRVV